MTDVLVLVLLVAGLFFLLVSTVGLIRLPDFYSRTHAAAKSETLGAILVLLAGAIHVGWATHGFKLLLIVFLVAITNPTGIHAISRAAIRAGRDIWVREDVEAARERARAESAAAARAAGGGAGAPGTAGAAGTSSADAGGGPAGEGGAP